MRRLAACLFIVALFPATALASPPKGPFAWQQWAESSQPNLDTQPGVVNTTGCPWNDQDYLTYAGFGKLTGSDTKVICLVADFDDSTKGNMPKQVGLEITAPTNSLTVSLTNDVGDSWTVQPTAVKNDWRWELCVTDPVGDAHNSDLLSFPELDGGRGQVVTYALTINGNTRSVAAWFEVHGSGSRSIAPRTLDIPCPANDGQ